MDDKDNLSARQQELLEAKNALSSQEVAEMDDFKIPFTNGEVFEFSKFIDEYPDPHIPLDMQVGEDEPQA